MAQNPAHDRASDPSTHRGIGGEIHQQTDADHPPLTTNQGIPVSDNQNSLRANPRGPTLLEDFVLREKIFHFDHERIPERIVHARGTAVHGYFELTRSLAQYTTAKILTEVGVKTPVFTRFSTVAGGAGSIDTPRDVRGFAVKFYTKEGNWDLVGNNIPVFFIQDAMKFPDVVHSVKMEPDRGFPQAASAHDTFWDFISLTPESMHMIMWIMSDRTIPRSLRMIEGFGVHSFRWSTRTVHRPSSNSTGDPDWDCNRRSGMRLSRLPGPIPIFTGATCSKPSKKGISRNGNWQCNCLRRKMPTDFRLTISMPPRLFQRNRFRCR